MYELKFGRDIKTRLNVLADRSGIKHRIGGHPQRRQFNVDQRAESPSKELLWERQVEHW